MVFKFADSQYHEKNALLQKIAKEPRKLELYTRTDLALIMARDQLFTEEGGDRPDKPNVMIVLTDGRPTKPKGDKSFNFKEFADKIAEDFKDVRVIAVGIGSGIDQPTLLSIAREKDQVVTVGGFSELADEMNTIKSKACSALNGGYSEWSETECSVTCGVGVKTSTRTCTNPPPSADGKDCSGLGPAKKTVSCNEAICPIDGGYTEFSESECSMTCGGGTKNLTRTCTNPPPSNGGKDCSELGPAEKTVSCNEAECPEKNLIRTCTNPPPSNGGKDCSELGPAEKTVSCNEAECPPLCTAGLDIAIVLDKSKSVKLPNLEKAITFIGDLVKTFHPAPDKDHFGFITFHEKAQMVFKFADSQYHDENALLQKIAEEPRKLELYTRTDLALIMARDQLFTEEGGDRPDKPNVMIVLTDGRPTKPKGDKNFDFKEFADKIAEDFKDKDVRVVAVGIGRGIDKGTLLSIADNKDDQVVEVENFSQLEKEMNTIKSKACSE
nr:coadhesin-like [Pocillopora verrucosa]